MKNNRTADIIAAELCSKAELQVGQVSAETATAFSDLDDKKLLHELQVHKVELEMQNSELRQANERLSEHEAHLRNIIAKTPAGYFHIDLAGKILDVNDAWLRMHGYGSKDEVIGKHYSIMQVDSKSDLSLKHMVELQKGVAIPSVEFASRRKDGSVGYHIFSAHPVVHYDQIVGFEWFIIDISDSKFAEQERILNESRMASLVAISQYLYTTEQNFLDHALSEVLSCTKSTIGYIYFYSEKKKQFTLNTWSGVVMKECTVLEQQTVYDLDKTGIWGEAVRQRRPVLVNDFEADNPLKKGLPTGHVVLSRFLTVPVIIDGEIVAVVGVANKKEEYTEAEVTQLTLFMDAVWKITAHKRAEAEKLNLFNQLQQAQKMESIGRLAGGVAHDFNNMLGVILGHAELGLMRLDPTHPMCADLKEIHNAAERSAELTRQLLAFARKQTVSPKVLCLNDTISAILTILQRLIGEDIHLTWQPSPEPWRIKIDPTQIDQIMANLCINARDAIQNTGRINILTENCSLSADYCAAHPYALPGDYVCITVSDDGHGMDSDTLARIFEPFFATKEQGKGTGLGLATVYGIVKQNNGLINVESQPGSGATFSIYLPRCEGKSSPAPAEAAQLQNLNGHETILLVEDEKAILDVVTIMLEAQGYTVLKAGTPGEAIRLAREHSGDIHLLMTDVIMPEMNGRDLAEKLLSTHPQMKRLFMSGYTADIIAHHGVLDEGVNFIQKPFKLPTMAAIVREVLDGSNHG